MDVFDKSGHVFYQAQIMPDDSEIIMPSKSPKCKIDYVNMWVYDVFTHQKHVGFKLIYFYVRLV